MTDLRSLAGLARSLAIYYGRPWRIGRWSRFYSLLLQPGELAFDIGAHVGNRSRALAGAGARVVALEPQALFYSFLRRTMPSGVTTLPLAAGARCGATSMSVSRLHPTVSTVAEDFARCVAASRSFATVTWDRSQPVEMTTLDALIAQYGEPALVKIDVEGLEAEVLADLPAPSAPSPSSSCPPCRMRPAPASRVSNNWAAIATISYAENGWTSSCRNGSLPAASWSGCPASGRTSVRATYTPV